MTTPTKLVTGTYDGVVCLYDMEEILSTDTHSLSHVNSENLRAHFTTVYSLIYLEGSVSSNGLTSIFPTFIGRTEKPTSEEFLVTIGYGRGNPELPGPLRTTLQPKGTALNVWLI